MKKITYIGLIVLPLFVQGQGMLYLSNLDQMPVGSASIGSDSWIAQQFTTGTNSVGYILNSVQLLLDATTGNPSGFSVSIYSSPGNGAPGSQLVNLTGSDPSLSAVYTYTASKNFFLPPSTFYFIVVTAETPIAQGSYIWSADDSSGAIFRGADGWTIQDAYYSSNDGSNWTPVYRENVFQMTIYATPVPEPAVGALFGLGLACLGFWRLRHSK